MKGNTEMTTFVGQAGVSTYQAIALKHGLKMYAACGMQPNRMWTPTAMLKTAGAITGQKFKRGQYLERLTPCRSGSTRTAQPGSKRGGECGRNATLLCPVCSPFVPVLCTWNMFTFCSVPVTGK